MIKQLEWKKKVFEHVTEYRADTPWGFQFLVFEGPNRISMLLKEFKSLDKAKAAAQAHYESLVNECLDWGDRLDPNDDRTWPERGELVLSLWRLTNEIHLGEFTSEEQRQQLRDWRVLYWMPAPEGPKED